MLKRTYLTSSLVVMSLIYGLSLQSATRKHETEVNLDGVMAKVFFNDGDTFRVLEGELKGTRVRVEGLNTLESYGPVHEWMNSSATYLFNMAKKGTDLARTGPWNCVSNKQYDTYGRLLATCDNLAKALLEKGLAHAFSNDSTPSSDEYLRVQKRAQRYRAGMWRNGIPDYIVTSLHSADEGQNQPYNRLISTFDGHSKRWNHKDKYDTCQRVCLDGEQSCMIYVPFNIRYGKNQPECLQLTIR